MSSELDSARQLHDMQHMLMADPEAEADSYWIIPQGMLSALIARFMSSRHRLCVTGEVKQYESMGGA